MFALKSARLQTGQSFTDKKWRRYLSHPFCDELVIELFEVYITNRIMLYEPCQCDPENTQTHVCTRTHFYAKNM